MKTDAIEKMRNLRLAANGMSGFWDRYAKLKADKNNDKMGAKFLNGMSDRTACFSVRTTFEAYCGQYGSSSVYTMQGFSQPDVAAEYIIRAMNLMAPALFDKAAELMRKDAADYEDAARKELAQLTAMIDEVANVEAE